ncbi:MAG: HEAT repeat domain-containing protein [Desulfobacterales bacterium]|nr:HEAT repeat domain-containing protein [Desulfobacterales bacterium]
MNDSAYLQKAVDALIATITAIRNIRLYPAGSAMVAGSVAKVHPILADLIKAQGGITYAESEKTLLVSGRSLPEKDAKKTQVVAFLDLMMDLGLKSLDFEPGLDPKSLETLLVLLSRKPSEIEAEGGVQALLAAASLPGIRVDQKVYVSMGQKEIGAAAPAMGLSEADIVRYLKSDGTEDVNRMRQLAANPEWVSRVFRTGLAQMGPSGGNDSDSGPTKGLVRLMDGLAGVAEGADQDRIVNEAAQSLALVDAKQIGKVLAHAPDALMDTGLLERLADRLDDDKFEGLAIRMKRGMVAGEGAGPADTLYDRLMETARGQGAKARIETRFHEETRQRKDQMARFKIAMERLLKGQTEALADPEVVEALPATVNRLLRKGKTQTAETLIQGLLGRLLTSPERKERTRIIEAVVDTGPAALPVITRQITPDTPWYYLRNLILLIGRIGTVEHLPLLEPLLTHNDFRIQREVFNAVYQIGGERRGDLLLKSLDQAQDPTKILIVSMLGNLRHHPARPALTELLHSSTSISRAPVRDRLQERICAALALIGDAKALPALLNVTQGTKEKTQAFAPSVCEAAEKAVAALGKIESPPGPGGHDMPATEKAAPAATVETAGPRSLDARVDDYVQAGDTDAAVKLIFNAIEAAARRKDFARAEALRERLFDVDAMALTEIIKAGEIIESEKSDALDQDHLDLWPELYETLTAEEANALFFAMTEQVFETNDTILEQGKEYNRLCFINEGQVKAVFRQGDREQLLTTVEKGAIVGHRTFFSPSVCTISMIALSRVNASVLDRSVLPEWKQHMPALESKLSNYCLKLLKTEDLLKKKGVDRREQKRINIQGKTRIQLLSPAGKPAGKPFRGELSDLSVGGLAFFIRSSKEETIRLLLGRRINIAFKIQGKSASHGIDQNATVIGIHYLQQNEYALHVRFEAVLDDRIIEDIDRCEEKGNYAP